MRPEIKIAGMLVAVSGFIIAPTDRLSTSNARPSRAFSRSVPDDLGSGNAQGLIDRHLRAQLDQYLRKVTSELGFSGSVLVAKGKRIIIHNGYGWADLKKTVRVNGETKFYIASITKQFTAAAILKLEEQHRLNVQDSIARYFKDVPQDKLSITIHHLLTHTSGLAQNYAADGIADRDEAVIAILKAPLKGVPGEKFIYSNDGYTLLAAIVEIASGQSYESFLGLNLLEPARLSQTGFWGDPLANRQPIAQMLHEITGENKVPNWGFRGATGMFSTTGDLYKWQQALLADRVLKKSSRERLFTPYSLTPKGMYTYGWFVSKTNQGLDCIWTAGSEDFGHNSIIKRYADGTVIIVASNAGDISGVPARTLVSDELEQILFKAVDARTR